MKTKKAVKYVEESLSDIYCDSCKDNGNLDICNYCHRKSMMWGISHEMAESIVDGIIKILESDWIPCSERSPEEYEWLGTQKFGTTKSDEVYVTFEDPKGERFCQHLSFQNGKLSGYDQLFIDSWHKGSKPIAWKPLPEPYIGDKDDFNNKRLDS